LGELSRILIDCSAVLISDYGKGVCEPEFIEQVVRKAGSTNTPVIVDPKGRDYDKYKGATCITPNVNEVRHVYRLNDTSEEILRTAAKKISDGYMIDYVLITRGSKGLLLYNATSDLVTVIPAVSKAVYDVAGAGDCVAAVMAATLSCQMDVETGARLANTAASLVVAKVGTKPVQLSELRDEV
jgi:D-beta-D-heptose 7-phosphate kinase/D-beta-D-heptose 1-phosphate adenosyltransferase